MYVIARKTRQQRIREKRERNERSKIKNKTERKLRENFINITTTEREEPTKPI